MRQPRESGEKAGDPQQRLLSLMALCLTVGGTLAAAAILTLVGLGQANILDAAGAGGIAVIGTVILFLTRRGHLRAAGFLAIGLLIAITLYYVLLEGTKITGLLLFIGGVVFADLLLGGRSGLVVATVEVLLYLAAGLAYQVGWIQRTYVSPFPADAAVVAVVLYGLALATGAFTREMRYALHQTQEREAARRAADEEKGRLLAELQAREEAQRHLLETIRELGSPVIPLVEGVIAMPLIGIVDSSRAQQVTTALLRGVTKHHARVVLIDITGVPVVDTGVAGTLLKAAQGIRLLGAEPILTGIRSEVAQTLVALGLDLSSVASRATLQEGLVYALGALGGGTALGQQTGMAREPAAVMNPRGRQ